MPEVPNHASLSFYKQTLGSLSDQAKRNGDHREYLLALAQILHYDLQGNRTIRCYLGIENLMRVMVRVLESQDQTPSDKRYLLEKLTMGSEGLTVFWGCETVSVPA
jgi:hypothetical protein